MCQPQALKSGLRHDVRLASADCPHIRRTWQAVEKCELAEHRSAFEDRPSRGVAGQHHLKLALRDDVDTSIALTSANCQFAVRVPPRFHVLKHGRQFVFK